MLGDLRSQLVSGGVLLSCLSCPPLLLGKPLPHRGPSWLGHMWDMESKMSLCPPGKEAPGPGTGGGGGWRQPWRDTPSAILRARFTRATGPGSDS